MESKNPVFRRQAYGHQGGAAPVPSSAQLQEMYDSPSYVQPTYRTMTIDDVVVRSFMTLGTLVVTGAAAWVLNVPLWAGVVSAIIGIVLSFVVIFKQKVSPPLVLGYAAFYGVFVGVISRTFESFYNGIVLQAVIGTALAFAGVLAVYALRIVRVTPKLVRFVGAAAVGALGLMLVNWVVGFFVAGGIGIRTDNPLGWIFSVAMILLGCFFLLLDFAEAEEAVKSGAPAKYAWMCAFGLTLTLVWIYLEVLRLISYFSSSD
ncbi:Bax inhibitor-1/YccA family protein [Sinosporangium siamense]|uniref:Membrane protein n=1 Tax=Sinosporangium siamense TaxID=1367973 RepID=A0A919V7L8_9ACTN|nr:Bax inhibitor-1/YccA family protein [Sinosporangium siamense]GII93241.1 membrane protein [Sinosporangium siamense]